MKIDLALDTGWPLSEIGRLTLWDVWELAEAFREAPPLRRMIAAQIGYRPRPAPQDFEAFVAETGSALPG